MVGIRENRHRPPLSVSKDACGLPALMSAQCPILESSLMFYGFLRTVARGHPEIHGIGELRLSLRRSEALFRQTVVSLVSARVPTMRFARKKLVINTLKILFVF